MLKNILCAIDGSTHADRAVALASDLADRYDARLVFLHVLPSHMSADQLHQFSEHAHLSDIVKEEIASINSQVVTAIGPHADIYIPPASPAVIARIGEVILEDARLVATEHGVTSLETRLESGDAAARILEWAKKIEADMIVMGSRGLGSFAALLMGSVSQKVSHHAACTCVAVK